MSAWLRELLSEPPSPSQATAGKDSEAQGLRAVRRLTEDVTEDAATDAAIFSALQAAQSERGESEPSSMGNGLRPKTLAQFAEGGQERVVRVLRVSVAAALQRGVPLPHILFDGPPGLGKTTLAMVLSNEMGTRLHSASAPALDTPMSLVNLLVGVEPCDVLFIDEVHQLPRAVCEYLYSAMEDFHIDWVEGKGPHSQTVRQQLHPFTLVGATTNPGLLPTPLRDRFGLQQHLEFYQPGQLARIAARTAEVFGVPMTEEGAAEIAARGRGTARVVNSLVERARDWAEVVGEGVVTGPMATQALHGLGIDEAGLTPLDRRYLRALQESYGGGPAGVGALAATLGEEASVLTDVVEPYLLSGGYVNRTAQGRRLTQKGNDHIAATRRLDDV